jgi:hypothetical protein
VYLWRPDLFGAAAPSAQAAPNLPLDAAGRLCIPSPQAIFQSAHLRP